MGFLYRGLQMTTTPMPLPDLLAALLDTLQIGNESYVRMAIDARGPEALALLTKQFAAHGRVEREKALREAEAVAQRFARCEKQSEQLADNDRVEFHKTSRLAATEIGNMIAALQERPNDE